MNETTVSVIIPVYNQFEKLTTVLDYFSKQSVKLGYEVVVVDDGSTDNLSNMSRKKLMTDYHIDNLELLHENKSGRAIARNNGVKVSQGRYIVFCDGDRIPEREFLEKYFKIAPKHDIIVGAPYDYLGNQLMLKKGISEEEIIKFSRLPQYYKKVCEELFDYNGSSSSKNSWLGFLVGNSCIDKSVLINTGGFSEDFIEWGFEHFELGYRMIQQGYKIFSEPSIRNFHMVHSRQNGFYNEKIKKSIILMSKKHGLNEEKLTSLFLGEQKYKFDSLGDLK